MQDAPPPRPISSVPPRCPKCGSSLSAAHPEAIAAGTWICDTASCDFAAPLLPSKRAANAVEELLTTLDQRFRDELLNCTQEEMEAKNWFFRFDPKSSLGQSLYEFHKALELLGSQARRWEEHHHGTRCVVERVAQKYLAPRIRQFIADGKLGAPGTDPILTCVYCGQAYPPGTPTHGAPILTAHIRVCKEHPMRKLELDLSLVRSALAGIVGTKGDDAGELDALEAAMRIFPGVESDKIVSLNAIHALRQTLPTDAPEVAAE